MAEILKSNPVETRHCYYVTMFSEFLANLDYLDFY